MLREVDLLLRLRHPNIVKGLEMVFLRPRKHPTCVQEYYEKKKEKESKEMEKKQEKSTISSSSTTTGGKIGLGNRHPGSGGSEPEGSNKEEEHIKMAREEKKTAKEKHEEHAMERKEDIVSTSATAMGGGGTGDASSPSFPSPEPPLPASTACAMASSSSSPPSPPSQLSSPLTHNTMYLVMEYCSFNLRDYMRSPFFYISSTPSFTATTSSSPLLSPDIKYRFLSRVKTVLYQILQGLHFLHSHCILHRDIKPSNILLNRRGEVKLCDFGLSTFYQDGKPLELSVVTPYYRAPEIFFGFQKYSAAVDVWSVGCMFAEMMLPCPLFSSAVVGDLNAPESRLPPHPHLHVGGGGGGVPFFPQDPTRQEAAPQPTTTTILPTAKSKKKKVEEEDMITERQVLWAMSQVLGIPNDETFPGLYNVSSVKEIFKALPLWNTAHRLEEVMRASPSAMGSVLLEVPTREGEHTNSSSTSADAAAAPPRCFASCGLDLLRRMLTWNPRDRISAAEALEHPFFHEEYPPCCPLVELLQPLVVPPPPSSSSSSFSSGTA